MFKGNLKIPKEQNNNTGSILDDNVFNWPIPLPAFVDSYAYWHKTNQLTCHFTAQQSIR